jgi:hypothetical protein
MGPEGTSGDKKKAIRICWASQKLAKPQIIKHIPLTSGADCGIVGATLLGLSKNGGGC